MPRLLVRLLQKVWFTLAPQLHLLASLLASLLEGERAAGSGQGEISGSCAATPGEHHKKATDPGNSNAILHPPGQKLYPRDKNFGCVRAPWQIGINRIASDVNRRSNAAHAFAQAASLSSSAPVAIAVCRGMVAIRCSATLAKPWRTESTKRSVEIRFNQI